MKLKLITSARKFVDSFKGNGPRVLVGDIETFPMLSYHWRMWKQNIATAAVVEDVSMMSAAVKWLGQPQCWYKDQRGKGEDMRDDCDLLEELHVVLSNADMIVAHNGRRFDMSIIRSRMVQWEMPPLPEIKVIDTLELNKKVFAFSSQSLAHVSPMFDVESKDDHAAFPGFKLWLECMKDNIKAWRECKTYNIRDITTLETMYLKTRGWHINTPNFGPYVEVKDGQHVCPNCGSTHVTPKGTRSTQVGTYIRYHCGDCGKYPRGRYQITSLAERKHILAG